MDDLLDFIIDENEDTIYTQIIKANLKQRHIVINSQISDELLESVCLMILAWNAEDKNIPADKRKKIYLYISSDGGDVIAGNMILDVLKQSITPIVTVGFAKCASMASYILAAGSERYCFPSTVILYHDGETGYCASGNKGKDIQRFYDNLSEMANSFMINNTKMTAEFLESIKDREYYIFANEAKELGIVDKIIGVDCTIDEVI